MYCPQCATQHTDGAKFCRSCGLEMEIIVSALSGKSIASLAGKDEKKHEPKTAQDWLEAHVESVRGMTLGAILLTVSLLLGVALALFLPGSFEVPWILIWLVFFGWMAIWGGIEAAYGVSGALESNRRLRLMKSASNHSPIDATAPPQSLSAGEPPAAIAAAFNLSPPSSVTEGTTRRLNDGTESSD